MRSTPPYGKSWICHWKSKHTITPYETSNHCNVTLILPDQQAMRSILKFQIDIDNTTKSRLSNQKLHTIILSHHKGDIQMSKVTMIWDCTQSHIIKNTMNTQYSIDVLIIYWRWLEWHTWVINETLYRHGSGNIYTIHRSDFGDHSNSITREVAQKSYIRSGVMLCT